jgi:hypothetical protein
MEQRQPHTMRRSGVGTGTISLLMIFTVLCFATLAMLSLSTAAASQRIQQRGVQGSLSSAEARGAAAEKVAALDAALLEPWRLGGGAAEAYLEAATEIALGQGWDENEENGTLLLILPAGDTSELVTELRLLAPGDVGRYEVVRQNTRILGGWQPGEDGSLWLPQ